MLRVPSTCISNKYINFCFYSTLLLNVVTWLDCMLILPISFRLKSGSKTVAWSWRKSCERWKRSTSRCDGRERNKINSSNNRKKRKPTKINNHQRTANLHRPPTPPHPRLREVAQVTPKLRLNAKESVPHKGVLLLLLLLLLLMLI